MLGRPLLGLATRVRGPRPGEAVLACRCGKVLDAADMCRPPRLFEPTPDGGARIDPIMCFECAERVADLGPAQ